MSEKLKQYFVPPTTERINKYLVTPRRLPSLEANKLSVVLLEGSERARLKTPTTGDATLLVTYKSREGAVVSAAVKDEDLHILQVQGGRQEGFRVDSGLKWVALCADLLLEISENPDTGLSRITMPLVMAIQGYVDATANAVTRYHAFACQLRMQESADEKVFVRQIRQTHS